MKLLYIPLLAFALALTGCLPEKTKSADSKRAKQTETMMAEAVRQVPPPAITNFQELKWQTFLLELRDKEIATYSYYKNLNGDLFLICESIGMGMPASVQVTNPERLVTQYMGTNRGYFVGKLPQPEPNGLFMPEGLSATYILCSNGKGDIKPVYWEPELIVSPFPLKHKGDIRQ